MKERDLGSANHLRGTGKNREPGRSASRYPKGFGRPRGRKEKIKERGATGDDGARSRKTWKERADRGVLVKTIRRR